MKNYDRIFVIVLDSLGIGAMPDSAKFGDIGVDTFGHILEKMGSLEIPNLRKLGMLNLHPAGKMAGVENPKGRYTHLGEASNGKDTMTGHWEMMGLEVTKPFQTFTETGFPPELIKELEERPGHKVIGNKPASGTAILDELGEEHLAKRTPIVYTSADSVFQIAAHEDVVMLTGDLCVGRVIARPFVGEKAGAFQRTSGRRDFSVEPFSRTLLDAVKDAGMESYGVGKIEDIFALRGLTGSNHAAGNPACIEAWLDYMRKPFDGLCFTNLVDTDMLYGHRRDPQGFADALAYFDSKLPEIIDLMGDEDLLVITADHGCDPTFKGTDHTREHIPLLVYHKGMKGLTDLGVRKTYADIGATCAEWLGLPERFGATSFADKLK